MRGSQLIGLNIEGNDTRCECQYGWEDVRPPSLAGTERRRHRRGVQRLDLRGLPRSALAGTAGMKLMISSPGCSRANRVCSSGDAMPRGRDGIVAPRQPVWLGASLLLRRTP